MRITKISVKGLFGMFDHEIPLNQESRITIVHGPNGVGKTVVQRMIRGLFQNDYEVLGTTPFEELRVDLGNAGAITVNKFEAEKKLSVCFDDGSASTFEPFQPVIFTRHELMMIVSKHIRDFGLVMKRGEPHWMLKREIEDYSGKYFYEEDAERYLLNRARLFEWWYQLPSREALYPTCPFATMPGWFRNIRDNVRTSLIETQRLMSDEDEGKLLVFRSEFELADAYLVINSEPTVEVLPDYVSYMLSEGFQNALRQKDVGALSELHEAVVIFHDVINLRILFKSLDLDLRKDVFEFISDVHSHVPKSVLSSGEQHLITLLFKLLFETDPDTLVMIDEPELSMNVVWQRNFLKDLQRIIELRNFDVLIATHSPQIIHDKWDWMVPLGEKVED